MSSLLLRAVYIQGSLIIFIQKMLLEIRLIHVAKRLMKQQKSLVYQIEISIQVPLIEPLMKLHTLLLMMTLMHEYDVW